LLVALGSLTVGRRVGREEGRDQLLAEQKAADDARRVRQAHAIPIHLDEPLPVPDPESGRPPAGAPGALGPGLGVVPKGGF
jgi:hypothetical protein